MDGWVPYLEGRHIGIDAQRTEEGGVPGVDGGGEGVGVRVDGLQVGQDGGHVARLGGDGRDGGGEDDEGVEAGHLDGWVWYEVTWLCGLGALVLFGALLVYEPLPPGDSPEVPEYLYKVMFTSRAHANHDMVARESVMNAQSKHPRSI